MDTGGGYEWICVGMSDMMWLGEREWMGRVEKMKREGYHERHTRM